MNKSKEETTALIVIDTESSVSEHLADRLMLPHSSFSVHSVRPLTTRGIQAMIERVLEDVGKLLEECPRAALFVDLVVHEDTGVYPQTEQPTYDNQGSQIAAALRRQFPYVPLFVITGKVGVPAEESLLSEASLEDVDGLLIKGYFNGKSSSEDRIHRIVEKGFEKRRRAQNEGVGIAQQKDLEAKFRIVNSYAQLEHDLGTWCIPNEESINSTAVIFLDIDDFKALNSRFTETIVDKTILPTFQRQIAKWCLFRGSAYRYGGEEFVVLLPNCTYDEALVFANALCSDIRSTRFPVDHDSAMLTVSIGVDAWTPGRDAMKVIESANQAEHLAKKNGKDRVVGAAHEPCAI